MIAHDKLTKEELKKLLKSKKITFAGNSKLKIFGNLGCSSGKRMRKENRIFFTSQQEASDLGYRPCGHCMKNSYISWKMSATS